ncbi:uncharacterized protein [Miscanthus floridulus]|uniref:uncharacterized protein n=1 Tax=Miscanthus floridulus TaxID=154761 RepID=UPI00345AB82C
MPTFVWWSESAITFDRTNHLDAIPHLGRYLLVIDPIVGPKRLTKVLMDRGSDLNIMYAKTLDEMGVNRMNLHPIRAPFHGVVPRFLGTFHAIIRHPCYMKFMAVPNYTYLKLKMSPPRRVITVGTSFNRAYECEVECCGHASAVIASEELATLMEEVIEETPDAKKSSESFESVEGSKEVLVDPSSSEGKKVHIKTALSSE